MSMRVGAKEEQPKLHSPEYWAEVEEVALEGLGDCRCGVHSSYITADYEEAAAHSFAELNSDGACFWNDVGARFLAMARCEGLA